MIFLLKLLYPSVLQLPRGPFNCALTKYISHQGSDGSGWLPDVMDHVILDKSPDEEVDGSKTTECQVDSLQRTQTCLFN